MKKLTGLLMALILMLSILPTAQASEYMNVYSLDGRVEVIQTSDFNAWHAVGWYSAPVMYVYALDGRSEMILKSDFSKWQAVGWYSAPMMYVYSADGRTELIPQADYSAWNSVGWYSDTPIMVYAPDGRNQYIPKNQFSQWQSAGWYSAPVMYMYAPDGRVQLILKSELSKWQKSGWYTKPVVTIYSGSKSKVVPREDFQAWHKAGWDTYIKIYLSNGRDVSILTGQLFDISLDSIDWYRNNDSLSQIEYSSNGTNITVEKAKEIALNYCKERNPYYNYIAPKLINYSNTSYLIGVTTDGKYSTGFDLVSVNKTTGYTFHCGAGSDNWAKLEALYGI